MDLQALADTALSQTYGEIRRLGRNLLLDCLHLEQEVPPAHAEHPDLAHCGDALSPACLHRLRQLADTEPLPASVDPYALSRLFDRLATALHRGCWQAPTTSPTDEEPKTLLVRYLSCRVIARYWLDMGEDVAEQQRIAACRKLVEVQQQQGKKDPDWRNEVRIGANAMLAGEGAPVWACPVDDETCPQPHLLPNVLALEPRLRAAEVARLLALPGFGDSAERRAQLGLVALRYRLPSGLLQCPTLVHGLGSPLFFPGYKREAWGRPASLDQDWHAPWQRTEDNSRLREWVHWNRAIASLRPELDWVGLFH